jgi:hypothetical protein
LIMCVVSVITFPMVLRYSASRRVPLALHITLRTVANQTKKCARVRRKPMHGTPLNGPLLCRFPAIPTYWRRHDRVCLAALVPV